jgi:glycosyltransferase involved in cell wall biosynthesis
MKTAVLHFALNPVTGVWSVMKELALGQSRSGLYASVGVAVVADDRWPQLCQEELANLPIPHYIARTMACFGTAQFLWQRIIKPPITQWVEEFATHAGADSVVVHCHNAWLSGVFLPLKILDKVSLRYVATFHGVNSHFHRQPVRKWMHRRMAARLMKHGAVLTSVDRANLERAQNLLGMKPDDFAVVPNGIADTRKRGCPRLAGSITFTLGHVGGMESHKGWRILVDAAVKLREMGHDIRVILAGRGSDASVALKMAEDSGGWLKYKGFVACPRETLFPELDALVLMSEQEGLPMAIIEALSMAVPVIATSVGGVPEAVIHGENGLIVPRSVEDLVAAVKQLLESHEKLRAMSAQARHSFEGRFEISRIATRYDAIYRHEI